MGTMATPAGSRPGISVYWQPGCSSCLKLKEFVEESGLPFESVNLIETPDAIEEVRAAGLQGIPVLRKGGEYIYAQSMDDVAALLGWSQDHKRLPNDILVERWLAILRGARDLCAWFDDETLARNAILVRERPLSSLCVHIFQIAAVFLAKAQEGLGNEREMMREKPAVSGREDLLLFADRIIKELETWRMAGGVAALPERMTTYYGDQPVGQVVERSAWHSAQHARQIDTIAAGLGNEFVIPSNLYDGLPMPRRLWA